MDEILKDDRFKHIVKDYRFKVMPKNERKFKVDKRFKNMFRDKKFKLKYTVDKRGRPTNLTTNDNLKKYYQISSSEQDTDDDDGVKKAKKKRKNAANLEKQVQKEEDESEKKDQDLELKPDEEKKTKSDDESSQEEEEIDDTDKEKNDDDDDDDDEDDDDDDDDETKSNEEEIPWNELDRDTERNENISSRLAICNMDWDRLKAVDLFVLLNSFKPPQGVIKSVKIYLSEYGKERIEYEKVHGPQELTAAAAAEEEEEDEIGDDEEGKNFDRGKLRVYQFNRLRYYYAIVECESSDTANKIYTECDGMEYESSCNRLDLRFVPDETTFDEADVRESCLEAPDPITYKPNLFFTSALNQTKVECTWDETPRDRLAMTMRKYTEDDIKNSDFRHILATSSEEEEGDDHNDDDDDDEERQKGQNGDTHAKESEEQNSNEVKDPEEERIRKYRELLMLSDKKSAAKKNQRDADLEFSWDGPLGSNQNDNDHDDDEGFNDLFNAKKKKNNKRSWKDSDKKKELTEEEKKQQAQLSLLTMDEEESKAHFNLDDLLTDKKQKRNKKKRSNDEDEKKLPDDFKINMQDPRFQAIFNNHEFNIDPSDQAFKKTKAMETLLDEKIKRIETSGAQSTSKLTSLSDDNAPQQPHGDAHVSLLVKSIKSKTQVLNRKKEDAQKNFKTKKF